MTASAQVCWSESCLVVLVLVLDRGAGQLCGRSEVSVTIDDHNVTHPKGNADPCTRSRFIAVGELAWVANWSRFSCQRKDSVISQG